MLSSASTQTHCAFFLPAVDLESARVGKADALFMSGAAFLRRDPDKKYNIIIATLKCCMKMHMKALIVVYYSSL